MGEIGRQTPSGGSATERRERSVKAGRTEAAARTEKRHARAHESDAPEGCERGAVGTEFLGDEAVSRDGPTVMHVSAVAGLYGRPYYGATPAAALGERRMLAARFEELGARKRRDVCAKAPAAETSEKNGEQHIAARWAGANKGGDHGPEYGARIVVREARRSKKDDAFAETPPPPPPWRSDVGRRAKAEFRGRQSGALARTRETRQTRSAPQRRCRMGACVASWTRRFAAHVMLRETGNGGMSRPYKISVFSLGSRRRAFFGLWSATCGRRYTTTVPPL